MRRGGQALMVAGLCLGLALPVSAQMMGPMGQMGQGGPAGPMGGGMVGEGAGRSPREGRRDRAMSHEGPLISIMLENKQELGLSPEQEKRLRDLRTGFEKDSVQITAQIRVLEIDLDSLLEQDKWDLARIEPVVKQIAGVQAQLRLARLKTLEAGRALLTAQQLEKLKQVGHRMRSPGGSGMGMGPGGPMGPGQPMRPGQPMSPGQPMGPTGPTGPGAPPAPRY